MSKNKVGTETAEQHIAMVQAHNAKMRANASAAGRAMMDEVDRALEEENAALNAQFEGDAKLRAWAKELLGFQISMAQLETLTGEIKAAKPGAAFTFQGQVLFKTVFNTVDRADRYIFALERSLVESVKKVPDPYTELSTSGLIKLAFKRLFKRSK
jgi:hypothetical protein